MMIIGYWTFTAGSKTRLPPPLGSAGRRSRFSVADPRAGAYIRIMIPRGILLLAVLAGVAIEAPIPPPVQDPVWSGVERIVAVGDVHGDHDQFVRALRAARVIDADENWIAGKTHLVQVGDVLDRGPDSRKALDLLMKLEEQAARAGGRVHALIGNHEAMILLGDLFYLHPREAEAYGGLEEFRKAMGPEGRYGRWIRGHDTVVKINDTLFVHGGISPRYADRTLREINEIVRRELSGKKRPEMTEDADGPLWYRGLALASGEEELNSLLEPVLRKHAASRIVVGHTATRGEISVRAGGRLVLIDVGMTKAYGGPAACLLIEKGKIFEVSPSGTRGLTSPREEKRSALPAGGSATAAGPSSTRMVRLSSDRATPPGRAPRRPAGEDQPFRTSRSAQLRRPRVTSGIRNTTRIGQGKVSPGAIVSRYSRYIVTPPASKIPRNPR